MNSLPTLDRKLIALFLLHLVVSLCPIMAEEDKDLPVNLIQVDEVPVIRDFAVLYQEGKTHPVEEPISLSTGPHLFIDDYLIAESQNVERMVQKPIRDPEISNPIVTGKEDGCFQPYMTILRDPETQEFRIWYGHRTEDFDAGHSHIGYMESEDGIEWKRPAKVLEDPSPIEFGVAMIDEGPDFADLESRFKYGWYMDVGLMIGTSPDGIKWTPLRDHPVILHSHDINGIFFDPIRERYLATLSVYQKGGFWDGGRRVTMHSYSDNLVDWDPARYVLLPHPELDSGETQFYAMDGYLARGDLLIGMVKVLRDDLKVDDPPDPPEAYGIGYTTLAWTRDGETWYRDTDHFFDPHPQKGVWDHAHAWIDEQVLVDGDEVYLYYGGYKRGHKVNRFEERQIGLVKMERDRYVARVAGSKEGTLRTPLVKISGNKITLNVDSSAGEVRVAILDSSGKALKGFGYEDCVPISADALEAAVDWKGDLSKLPEETVSISMKMTNAQLFGLSVEIDQQQ